MDLVINNDDLLNEILLRLPAKSLIRFKSVRKKWLSLISSDEFCQQHTLRCPQLQPSLIVSITTPEEKLLYWNQTINGGGKSMMMTRTVPYSMHTSVEQHRIIQACNGLLLLQSLYVKDEYSGLYYDPPANERDRKWSYYVYNPATRQSREITLAENSEYPRVAVTSLAFDPSKSPYYKIVCLRYTAHLQVPIQIWSWSYQIEVYDSESHDWKVIAVEPAFDSYCISSTGIYWNNSIYWEMFGACHRFDISTNEMKTLLFPQIPIDIGAELCIKSYILELNGRLHCVQIICEEEHYEIESVAMWELGRDEDGDDHHSQWLLKHHHSLGENTNTQILTLTTLGSGSGSGSGSDGGDRDGDETCKLLVHQDEKIRAYNFHDKTYDDLLESITQPAVFQVGESLALV